MTMTSSFISTCCACVFMPTSHQAQPVESIAPWYRCERLRQIEAIQVHHLGPGCHEIAHQFLLSVRASVDFSESAQLRVGTEHEVSAGGGPFERAGLAIAAFVELLRV